MSAMEKISRVRVGRGAAILSRMSSEGPLEEEASEQRPTGTEVQGIWEGCSGWREQQSQRQ